MAREACLSLSRFSREFHREIGVTYWDYLTDLRMEQAKRLLAGPSLSLQEIGRRVGYRTQDTFSRAFNTANGHKLSFGPERQWCHGEMVKWWEAADRAWGHHFTISPSRWLPAE